jgi:hypothetical protein
MPVAKDGRAVISKCVEFSNVSANYAKKQFHGMSGKQAQRKWSELFCRVANRDDGTPRFSLIGAKGYLY